MSYAVPWRVFVRYLASRLFGVGVGLLVFILLFNGFKLHQMSGRGLSIPFSFFYGYGLLFACLADFLARFVKYGRSLFCLVLYIIGGYLPFLWTDTAVAMIGGTLGAFFSLIVLVASFIIENHWPYSALGAAGLLINYMVMFML
ncbi:hypothetical protein EV294_107284 [Paenibacillus sp. BK033]|nr:hypothetical protein EV294_107284 [Paenibacillus sp. BK033]